MEKKKSLARDFGSYEILGELGRGGMGVVYKAHEKSLGREVALKILPSQMAANAKLVERFQREARANATLNHPNIVPVYAVGEHQGTHFIAMELVRGKTLAQILEEKGPMEVDQALRILKEVADALREAHRQGIIHRDIKPSNIMIDHRGRAKVMDFGLARISAEATELTRDGAKLGTPAYMSPEQCEGKKLDVRTDIYSLGVTLYVMLTKKLPFRGEDALSTMFNITNATFPNLKEVRPDSPSGLCQMLRNMVAKDPVHRYESVKSLIVEIQNLLNDANCHVGLPGAGALAPAEKRRSAQSARGLHADSGDIVSIAVDSDLQSQLAGNDTSEILFSSRPRRGRTVLMLVVGVGLALFAFYAVRQPAGLVDEQDPQAQAGVDAGPDALLEGLVAYWSFDEGRGAVARDAVGQNHGALHSAKWARGVRGTGIEFNGGYSSYVQVPHSDAISPTKAVTVTAWVKVFEFRRRWAAIVYKLGGEPTPKHNDREYSLWAYRPYSAVYGAHFTSTPDGKERGRYITVNKHQFDLNEFFHIAGVVDAENQEMSLYVNGTRVGWAVYDGSAIREGNGPLRLGGMYRSPKDPLRSGGSLLGIIDEVRIYDRALTANQIRIDMNRIKGIELGLGHTTFADAVVEYQQGSGVGPKYSVPSLALGAPDQVNDEGRVSLGQNGQLTLKFIDNALTTSGGPGADLWVYETGGYDELVSLQIKKENGPWIDVGSTRKTFSGVDIDAYIGRGVELGALYPYVRLIDLNNGKGAPARGADIDAVAAISSEIMPR